MKNKGNTIFGHNGGKCPSLIIPIFMLIALMSQGISLWAQTPEDKIGEIISALKNADVQVQRRAAGALGWLGDRRAVEPLIEALKSPNEDVRAEAAWALGKIADVKAVGPLTDVLKNKNETPQVRREAVETLGILKDGRAVEALIQALSDPTPGVRARAASALGLIGDNKAIDPLIGCLKDEAFVKSRAAESLSKITGQNFEKDNEKQATWKAWRKENKDK
jgi:HEAT repeat protein